MFRTIYSPSTPYGGKDELKEFVAQEVVYPPKAKEQEIEGDAFITYKIDAKGKVIYKEVVEKGDPLLKKEAARIFDKILWEADPQRFEKDLGFEKLKFSFDLKKYKKVVKKRGYDQLPFGDYEIDSSSSIYTINQVDEQPEITNASSVNGYVSQNFNYPSIALQRGISGRVTVEFVIEPYGLVSNLRVIEPVAGGCNDETERLIKAMKWKPGFKDNKAVRTLYKYQLNFVHPGGSMR
jgi:TonB family protein